MKYLFAAMLFLTPAFAHEYKLGDLTIDHPFARATPNGAKVGGGYLSITNKGKTADRLVSAEVSFATRVEIHEMKVADGIMRMRELPQGLAIGAGETVSLKPGGYHIMFMGLKQPLMKDEKHKAILVFEKAGKLEVDLHIEGMGGHQHAH
jgi:periplasmic copper chaperone A